MRVCNQVEADEVLAEMTSLDVSISQSLIRAIPPASNLHYA